MSFESITSVLVVRLLANAGFDVAPAEIEFERRDQKWRVTLPGERIAWIAASVEGRRQLSKERKILQLIHAHCDFSVPEVIYEHASAEFDVRAMVSGTVDPRIILEHQDDAGFLRTVGADIGSILAQQHTRIDHSAVSGWLPSQPGWPKPGRWILDRLPRVIDDVALIDAAETTLHHYHTLHVDEPDRVLIHGDIGFHNLAIDVDSGQVNGLFDYGDAAWADRHHDFRYMDNDTLLEAALREYEPVTGCRLDRGRLWLYNAVCAISFLAFRDGIPPGQRWCGRTLAEDLAWTRSAIDRCNLR